MKFRKITAKGIAALMCGSLFATALPICPKVNAAGTILTVGQNGTYKTVNAAVSAAAAINPSNESDRVTIAIEPGTYREQVRINTPYLSFVNSNPAEGAVLVTWYYGIGYKYYSTASTHYYDANDAASKSSKAIADRWGTAVRIQSNAKYFRAENITFENSFNRYITSEELADGVEPTGETLTVTRNQWLDVTAKSATERAAAMCVEADGAEFYNCNFLSSQDTLYTASAAYFRSCKIQGNTDYIFGSGDVVFDACELCFAGYSDKGVGGYITAAREQNKGYLFWNCNVTQAPNMKAASGYFGRPWKSTAKVLFYQTKLQYESIITAVGWTSMSGVEPSQATFREYGTKTASGGNVNTGSRTYGTVLYSSTATRADYLNGWTPAYFDATSGLYEGGGTPSPTLRLKAELIADSIPTGTYANDYPCSDSFTIRANNADAVITVDQAAKTSTDGVVSSTNRIKMGGAGSTDNRSLQITARNKGYVKIYVMSSNSESTRNLLLLDAFGNVIARAENISGTSLYSYALEIPQAGCYYLTSENSGINIYGVQLYQDGDDEIIATTTTTTTTTTAMHHILVGDVNCDGKVSIADAVLLSRYVNEEAGITLSSEACANANCDNDPSLTYDDVSMILRIIARLV